MYLKFLEKQKPVKPTISQWKETIKIKGEINDTETINLYKNSMKQKVGSSNRLINS
jgi:hypothetical protein